MIKWNVFLKLTQNQEKSFQIIKNLIWNVSKTFKNI